MKITNFALQFAVITAILAIAAFGQSTFPQPKQEKLLNGLNVLLWPDSTAKNVEVRIRIHAGAAFDPQGKEGVMKLLAENIFPNEATRDYFKEDLGGGIEIVTKYDYIEVTASGKSEDFVNMLQTLATAVANPTIDKETTAKLRTALLATVKELEADPSYAADQAVAKRLFGTFPYGRPQYGTTESIQKIDFADLIAAKQRFLTADNATVAISGNFDKSLGLRAVRRYFGAWLKSDKRVPSTFRQPDPPPAGMPVLTITSPKTDAEGVRFAMRGVARSDKDLAASLVFTQILGDRLKSRFPSTRPGEIFVRNEFHTLPGIIVIGLDSVKKETTDKKLDTNEMIQKILSDAISDVEFQTAKNAVQAEWTKKDGISFWLDADTFKIASPNTDMHTTDGTTLADVNAYAEKIRKRPIVAVLVNPPPAN